MNFREVLSDKEFDEDLNLNGFIFWADRSRSRFSARNCAPKNYKWSRQGGVVSEVSNLSATDSGALGALLYESGRTIYNLGTSKWDGGLIQEAACKLDVGSCPVSIPSFRILLSRIKEIDIENSHEIQAHLILKSTCIKNALTALDQGRFELSQTLGFISAHEGYCNNKCGLIVDLKDDQSVVSFKQVGLPSHPPKKKFIIETADGVPVPVCSEKIKNPDLKASTKPSGATSGK